MSKDEKKKFFDKIYDGWKGKDEKNESINESRSISKVQKELTTVKSDMSKLAKEYSKAEGDTKATILKKLKDLTATKKRLEAELDKFVSDTDKDVELVVDESVKSKTHVVYAMNILLKDGSILPGVRVSVKKGNDAEGRAVDIVKNKLGNKFSKVTGISKALNPHLHTYTEGVVFGSKYDIGSGSKGSGIVFWNKLQMQHGDYKNLAHVSDTGKITWYVKRLPLDVINHIQSYANTKK